MNNLCTKTTIKDLKIKLNKLEQNISWVIDIGCHSTGMCEVSTAYQTDTVLSEKTEELTGSQWFYPNKDSKTAKLYRY